MMMKASEYSEELVHRNALNMDNPLSHTEVVDGNINDITEAEEILRSIEVIS